MTYFTRLILLCLFIFPITAVGQEETEILIEEIPLEEINEIEEVQIIDGGFLIEQHKLLEENLEELEKIYSESPFNRKREILINLRSFDYYSRDHGFPRELQNQLTFSVMHEGEVGRQYTIELEHGKEWYSIFVPELMGFEAMMEWRGELRFVEIPAGKKDIYISIMRDYLFPAGVKVWTQDKILKGIRSHKTEVYGKIPIEYIERKDIPSEIFLHLPFANLDGKQHIYKAQLEGDLEWRNVKFKFELEPFFTSIAFLKYGNTFFPFMLAPRESYNLRWEVDEKNKSIQNLYDKQCQHCHGVRAQNFLSHRYPEGLSPKEYRKLISAFNGNRESRMDTLIAWSRAIVPFYEENHSNPKRFLEHINQIGNLSWKDLFEEAYQDQNNSSRRDGYDDLKEISAIFLMGFFLSLVLFAFGIYSMHRGSRYFNLKRLEKIEWIFHSFFWLFFASEAMPRARHAYVELPSIAMWMIFAGVIALFTVNWKILCNRYLLKKRWGKYLLSVVGLSFIYGILNLTQLMNPFLDNTFAYVDGNWMVTSYPFNYGHPAPGFEDLQIMFMIMLVVAPIYAAVRYVMLNGFPRLRAQKVALNAELNTLKTQISPHFFFNSLNTVYGFALTEDSPRTAEAITKLSDLMRFAIYQGDQKQIPLETELEYLSDYIDMQRLRLNPIKHDLQYRVDGEPANLQIAPLMLITLIENAFKHGISMSKDSYIHIDLYILEKGLILTVENSVHPKDMVAVGGTAVLKESGVGLVNTKERLKLLYAGRHEWRIEEDEDRYFTQLSLDLAE
ncbi:MAG: sensor histidine kinase [Bacteroidota bacterium]